MSMFDNDFLSELAETKVAEKGDFLKPRSRSGKVVFLGCDKKMTDQSGEGVFLQFKILSLTTAAEAVNGDASTNEVGQVVSKSFFLNDGSKDKKAAVRGDLIRTACAIYSSLADDDVQARQIQGNTKKLAEVLASLEECRGVLGEFSAYDTETKAGEKRTYHNMLPVKQAVEDVKKRRDLLAKNAPVTAFI